MNKREYAGKVAELFEKGRAEKGYTQAQMAQLLDISLTTYKRIISCEDQKIDAYVLHRFHTKFKHLFLDLSDSESTALSIYKKLLMLSERQLKAINSMVDFELSFAAQADTDLTIFVPTGNMEDGMIWDSANREKLSVSAREGVSCGIKITSDNFAPIYFRDDILLVSQRPIRDGDTGIFIHKPTGRAYIRKYKHTQPAILEPINNYGEPIFIVEDIANMTEWVKFGVVVSKVR